MTENKHISNYDQTKYLMQEKFASENKIESVAKEWGLPVKDNTLFVTFLGKEYQVDGVTGAISYYGKGEKIPADFNVSMTLFDILSRKKQFPSGKYQPTDAFSTVYGSTYRHGSLFDKQAKELDRKEQKVSEICALLGGTSWGKGDVCVKIPVFEDLEVVFQYWNSDEEFEAALHFLCDTNTLNYMHYETMWYMLSHLLDQITAYAAGGNKE